MFNPYTAAGGGGQSQMAFHRILRGYRGAAEVQELSTPMQAGLPLYRYWNHLKRVRRFREQVAGGDLLILQGYFDPGGVMLARYATKARVPYVVIPRGDLIPTRDLLRVTRNAGRKWLMWLLYGRWLFRNAAAVVVTSELEKRRLQRVGARTDHVRVIPNPVRSPSAEPPSSSQDGPADRPFAIALGRISREKGLDLLLESWPAVQRRCPDALLVIAGPVDHPDVYRQLIDIRGSLKLHDAVLFKEWIGGSQKTRWLSQARCLVLPSHCESFGNGVLEALSVRTPVIASTGTPWSHLEGACGRWLARDPRLWADAIADYLSAPVNQRVPSEDVRRVLALYREEIIAARWSGVLDAALAAEPGRSAGAAAQ